jgi:MFS family permease
MGFFFLPLLVGPIVAPVVGGLITAALDWRAVFMFCAALGLPILCLALALPETHQWLLLRARERAATAIVGAGAVEKPPRESSDEPPASNPSYSTTSAVAATASPAAASPDSQSAVPADRTYVAASPAAASPDSQSALPTDRTYVAASPAAASPDSQSAVPADRTYVAASSGRNELTPTSSSALPSDDVAASPTGGPVESPSVGLPDTHATGSTGLAPILEEVAGEVPRPQMHPPWAPLRFIFEADLAPYYAVGAAAFGSMFVSFTVFPGLLAAPPYSLSPSVVGAAYLPIGVCLLLGSLWGGHASDKAGHRRPGASTARLLPSLLGACCLPAGVLLFGWAGWAGSFAGASGGGSLAGVLLGHALIDIGQSSFGPGFFAYLSAAKQAVAAAAGAAALALNFTIAAGAISAAVPIQERLGIGGLFSLIAGVNLAIIAWAAADFVWRWRRELALDAAAPVATEGDSGSGTDAGVRIGCAPEPAAFAAHPEPLPEPQEDSAIVMAMPQAEGRNQASGMWSTAYEDL